MPDRLRAYLWPRCGWWRACVYQARRMARLPGSPHMIAAGVAAGVFASCTPFLGFQMILGALVAVFAGGSVLASAMATWFGNPLTYPILWLSSFQLGELILGEQGDLDTERFLASPSIDQLMPVIEPLTVGGLMIGIAAGAAVYAPVRWGLARMQRTRRERIASRRGMAAAGAAA